MNHGDPGVVKAGAEKAKERERLTLNSYARCLADAPGRSMLYELLEMLDTWKPNVGSNGSLMAQQEGRRSVGLFLEKRLRKINAKNYVLMLDENEKN